MILYSQVEVSSMMPKAEIIPIAMITFMVMSGSSCSWNIYFSNVACLFMLNDFDADFIALFHFLYRHEVVNSNERWNLSVSGEIRYIGNKLIRRSACSDNPVIVGAPDGKSRNGPYLCAGPKTGCAWYAVAGVPDERSRTDEWCLYSQNQAWDHCIFPVKVAWICRIQGDISFCSNSLDFKSRLLISKGDVKPT